MQSLIEFVKTLGPARIAAMAAVTAALIGFFMFLMIRVTAPAMTPLFTDLPPADSGSIVKDLERQAIAYELRNDGATILIPKDQVTRVRMKLAESGLPKGAGIGYEIFDKSDALGSTSFVQNINHLRALEGELSRTIRAIDRVQGARVHLVIPERPLFSRERAEPSASIVLKVRGALEQPQVRAIRHLVATAVNGLKPDRVSIVDEGGHLLADGTSPREAGALGGSVDERQAAFERRMKEQIESIVSSVVGPNRARVQLTAEFDFNRITETSDKYDPESRVVRSSQTREETSSGPGSEGQVSVGNELPGASQRADSTAARDQNKKNEEVVNYEISRVTKTETIEGGRVKRVSVAVVVDGQYVRSDKGDLTYQPRTKDEMDRISALVRSAIGFDSKRGDQVEVANLRFADTTVAAPAEPSDWLSMLRLGKDDLLRMVELSVMALLGLLVMFLVIRPLVRRIITPENPAHPALAAPEIMPIEIAEEELQPKPSQAAKMIDIAKVQGQVHAQSVQKVGELAQQNPHETVAILRQWLHATPPAEA